MGLVKKMFNKFDSMKRRKKLEVVTAVTLTVCMLITLPSYAWFSEQRKAAEMFKVEYPNSLYINAAHREDRVFFDLGAIDVGGYEKDDNGDPIYYYKSGGAIAYTYDEGSSEPKKDEYGHYIYKKDDTTESHKITDRQYVFSVSGTGMDAFLLQLAHTNNNKFRYEVYEATQYSDASDIPAGTDKSKIVKYTTSKNSHSETRDLQIAYDPIDDSAEPVDMYYVREDDPLDNDGKPVPETDGYKNNSNGLGIRDLDNFYYAETYGSYATSKVHEDAMPSYWHAAVTLTSAEKDANSKGFCKYFILRVTWDANEQKTQEKKETDMIYFSAKRN